MTTPNDKHERDDEATTPSAARDESTSNDFASNESTQNQSASDELTPDQSTSGESTSAEPIAAAEAQDGALRADDAAPADATLEPVEPADGGERAGAAGVAAFARDSDPISAELEAEPSGEPRTRADAGAADVRETPAPEAAEAESHGSAYRVDDAPPHVGDAPPHVEPAANESPAGDISADHAKAIQAPAALGEPVRPLTETPPEPSPATGPTFSATPMGDAPAPIVVEPRESASDERTVVASTSDRIADEPAVTEVAPLAVSGAAVAAAAPVVVKTRTGPVALDAQPEPIDVAAPARVPVRGLDRSTPSESTGVEVLVPAKPQRLASLDLFRGLTIALMVLVNNPGSWGNLYGPLGHAEWHGWTLTDLVFPFFLFIVGVATPFSLGKRAAIGGASKLSLLGHIWLRALALVLLGILLSGSAMPLPFRGDPDGLWLGTKAMRLFGFGFAFVSIIALLVPWKNRAVQTILPLAIAVILVAYCVGMHFVRATAIKAGWPAGSFGGGLFNPDMLRLPGVLQRIGLCYGVAATVALLLGRFGAWLLILATIGVYSWLMLGVSFKGSVPGSLERYDNLARAVDVFAFERWHTNAEGQPFATQKHTYGGYPDPEGLLSTLPAIATTLIGVLAGFWLRRGDRTAAERCAGLLARGVVVACVGVLLSWWLMPINKNLWTPSYAVLTAGLAMLTLGAIFWIADVRMRRWWGWPLKVMGMNAIAAFVASVLVIRVSNLIVLAHPFDPAKTTNPVGWMKLWSAEGVGRAAAWLGEHRLGALGAMLDTPQNDSLAGAIAFLLVIFALMLVLYVCRIFVKV